MLVGEKLRVGWDEAKGWSVKGEKGWRVLGRSFWFLNAYQAGIPRRGISEKVQV